MNKNKFILFNVFTQKIFICFFIMTPSIIFFSKFLSDFFLSLIAFYTLAYLIKSKNSEYLKILVFFFVFVFYISFNLVINNFNQILFLKSIALIRFPLFILFPLCVNFDKKLLDQNFKILFLCPVIIFTFNLYFQAIFNYDIFGNELINDYARVTSFFGNEFIAGSYLFFIFTILLAVFKTFTPIKLLLLSLIYFGIFLSGDRTPFIVINLFLFICFILNFKDFMKSKQIKILLLFVSVILSSFTILHYTKAVNLSSIYKYENTFKDIVNDIKKEKNDEGLKRWPYYGMMFKSYVILKNNFLFGTTYKSYRNECSNLKYKKEYLKITNNHGYDGCSTHPHNVYLEILSEQGVIGFILLLLLIYNLSNLNKFIFTNLKKNYFLIFIFCYFFPLKPHGSLYTNFNLIMLASTLGYYLIFNKKTKE